MRILPYLLWPDDWQFFFFSMHSISRTATENSSWLAVCVLHMQLCGWAARRHSWPHWGWLHAAGAAWCSPGCQIQMHHIRLCLRCWPGHWHHHLVEDRDNSTQSDGGEKLLCGIIALYSITMLNEKFQSFSVAVLSCDPHGCHPMSITSRHLGSMSEQQNQDSRTTHLM